MKTQHYYTDEKNAQIVIALLKAHGIKDIIISPGATNDCFVLSVQGDDFFRLYSAVDERHAAYMACGMAAERRFPVVLSCTGATASRNYMSGLTEAYYRKLPVLAITSSQPYSHLGNLNPQMTDRLKIPSDIVNLSVQCPTPHTDADMLDCELKVNQAILTLFRRGGGSAHINLETNFSMDFPCKTLPAVRKMFRIMPTDSSWPNLPVSTKIVVWIGSHPPMSDKLVSALNNFIASHDAVVLGDVTSNCRSDSFLSPSLLLTQVGASRNPCNQSLRPDLIIHIGEVSGDYPTFGWLRRQGARVWRVSEDGELRDFFQTLEGVFEMPEDFFFDHYAGDKIERHDFSHRWQEAVVSVPKDLTNVGYSEVYIANELAKVIPRNAEVHLGILNPIRCANLVGIKGCAIFANVGGFGIDGNLSSVLGASLVHPDKLYFIVLGDLSFFYNMNALGSRHLGKNLRVLLLNNGEGAEFSMPGNVADKCCGDRVHKFIAAHGHYGKKSPNLIRHYAEDLGLSYLSASTKEELRSALKDFVGSSGKSVVLECFTDVCADSGAVGQLRNLSPYVPAPSMRSKIKSLMPIKHFLGKGH